jgi:hypothetical protein
LAILGFLALRDLRVLPVSRDLRADREMRDRKALRVPSDLRDRLDLQE